MFEGANRRAPITGLEVREDANDETSADFRMDYCSNAEYFVVELACGGRNRLQVVVFGMCTSRYTPSEQAEINAQRRLEALLRDPTRAGPELEQRLRKQMHYSSGLLLIEDPVLHSITTLPATIGWAIDCGNWGVTFGATGENGRHRGESRPAGHKDRK
jgi:hypothetical protein